MVAISSSSPRTASRRSTPRPAACWPRSRRPAAAATRGSRGPKARCGSGHYRDRKIHQIDPETGTILRTIESNRFVTGVTWVDGELWHATWEGDESDLRRVDPRTGEVLEQLDDAAGRRRLGARVRRRRPVLLRRRQEREGQDRPAAEAREPTVIRTAAPPDAPAPGTEWLEGGPHALLETHRGRGRRDLRRVRDQSGHGPEAADPDERGAGSRARQGSRPAGRRRVRPLPRRTGPGLRRRAGPEARRGVGEAQPAVELQGRRRCHRERVRAAGRIHLRHPRAHDAPAHGGRAGVGARARDRARDGPPLGQPDEQAAAGDGRAHRRNDGRAGAAAVWRSRAAGPGCAVPEVRARPRERGGRAGPALHDAREVRPARDDRGLRRAGPRGARGGRRRPHAGMALHPPEPREPPDEHPGADREDRARPARS